MAGEQTAFHDGFLLGSGQLIPPDVQAGIEAAALAAANT